MDQLLQEQFNLYKDEKYKSFNQALIPNIDNDFFIGVNTNDLKTIIDNLITMNFDFTSFLNTLPHHYFEENQIHILYLNRLKYFKEVLMQVKHFLPYINNWATCDQLNPKPFKKHALDLLPVIKEWIDSEHPYTIRFGILCLKRYFLDEHYSLNILETVSNIKSDEYYINMMIAWFFQEALVKQYDDAVKFIDSKYLSPFIINKTISKACDSFRLTNKQKEQLKLLRIKK